MTFDDDAYAGQPAVVERTTGEGRSLYVGTVHPDDALLEAIVSHALAAAGIESGPFTEEYVEVVRRGPLVFAINHRAQATRVELGASCALVGELEGTAAVLPAWGVCVAERADE
jgi:beta-galactosidase